VGFRRSANTVILVKGLNREKFCPGATSFLPTGSSVYIAGVWFFEPSCSTVWLGYFATSADEASVYTKNYTGREASV
jgi:hypothetical protein